MESIISPAIIGVFALVVIIIAVVGVVVRRYQIAGPDTAIIVTGRKGQPVKNPETGNVTHDLSGQKVVMGGGVFVLPFVQSAYKLSLASRRIEINIKGAVSQNGIRLDLRGVAIVKVGGSEDAIRAAAQRFLNQQNEISTFTEEVLAGSLRSIVGGLTVDEIIRDRAAFASKVAEESESSMTGQGLVLDTFQIQEVTDDVNYLRDLGRPEAALAKQRADIAEANSKQASQQAQLKADEEIANSQRVLSLRQAEIRKETDAAAAEAAAAGPLAQAAQQQNILTQEEQVVQRKAAVTERQLDVDVRRPAEAQRFRVEQEAEANKAAAIAAAEANKAAAIAAAEAEAERQRLSGQGEFARRSTLAEATEREAKAELERRRALAAAVEAEGLAEAAAILAKGNAEAEALEKRAEAFKEYGEAAIVQSIIEVLPNVARELASPMANIKDLRVISTDGASQLSKNVTNNLAQTLEMVQGSTGVDLMDLIKNFTNKDNSVSKVDAQTPRVVTADSSAE